MPLIYNGQEVGANRAMGLFDVNPVPWTPVNTAVQNLFKQLTKLKRSQAALENGKNRGTLVLYNTTDNQVFAYSRKKGNNEIVVLLNFNNTATGFKFSGSVPPGKFVNYLGSGQQTFNTSDNIQLPANGYAVYIKQ